MLYLPKEITNADIKLRLQLLFIKAPQMGQGLAEYAVVLLLVSIVVIAVLALLGPQVGQVFSTVRCSLEPDAALREICHSQINP